MAVSCQSGGGADAGGETVSMKQERLRIQCFLERELGWSVLNAECKRSYDIKTGHSLGQDGGTGLGLLFHLNNPKQNKTKNPKQTKNKTTPPTHTHTKGNQPDNGLNHGS